MGCWWVIICSPFSSWNLEYRMLEPLYRYLTTILSFLYRIYNGSITLSTSFCQTIHRSHPSSLYAFIFPTIYYCIQLSSSFLSDTFRTVCILPPQLLYHCIHLFNSYITIFRSPPIFITLFIFPAHSWNSWNITFIPVFISPAPLPLYSYLQLHIYHCFTLPI